MMNHLNFVFLSFNLMCVGKNKYTSFKTIADVKSSWVASRTSGGITKTLPKACDFHHFEGLILLHTLLQKYFARKEFQKRRAAPEGQVLF
jgi:hypothetical protein